MMLKRLIAGALSLCALAFAQGALAQVKITAPSGTQAPAQGVCFGTLNATATCVDASNPLPTGRPDVVGTAPLNAATSNAAYTLAINGQGTAGFIISGLTASTATLTLEGSYDGGAHYAAIMGVAGGTGVLSSTFTADTSFSASAGGRTNIRLRVSATGTGTITVASNLSAAAADVALRSPLPPGSNTIGAISNTTFGLSGTLPAFATPPTVKISQAGSDNGVADANNAAFHGEVPMPSLDTTYTVGRSLKAVCTVAGDVSVTYTDASTGVWAVSIGNQTFPVAATKVNSSGTTATCTFSNLL